MNHFFSIELTRFLKSMLFDFGVFIWFPVAIFVISTSRLVRRLAVAMACLIVFFGTNIFPKVGNQILTFLAGEDSLSNCPASAIVVLAGGVTAEHTPNIITQLRLRHAAEILSNLDLPFIYSGGVTELAIPESEIMANFAQALPHQTSRETYLERESRTTHENAVYTAQLADRLGLAKSIVLVTSSWHLLRARLTFEKAGVKVCGSAPVAVELNRFWEISFQNALDSRVILNEFFGLVAYFVSGWI